MTRKKDIASSSPALAPQKTKNPEPPPTFSSAENGAAKMIVETIIDGARKDSEHVKATKTVGDGPPEPLNKNDALRRMLGSMRTDEDLEHCLICDNLPKHPFSPFCSGLCLDKEILAYQSLLTLTGVQKEEYEYLLKLGERARNTVFNNDLEADQAGPLTFTRYRHGGILPQIKHAGIRGYSVGSLADIFRESGYFGELTPAQIAVHILAGQELGFGPVKSMFDLKITPGEIFFSSIGSFDSVETDTEITKSQIEEAANLANKRDLSPFPEKDDLTPAPDSETISAAAQLASLGPIPVEPLRERETRREYHADLADALAEFAVTNEPAAIVDDISFGTTAADFTPPPPAAVTTPPATMPADNAGADDAGSIPGSNLQNLVAEMAANAASPAPEPPAATPPATIAEPAAVAAIPYNPADAGAFGDETPAAVMDWQQNIERYCKELGIDAAEKVSKFRQIPTVAEKQKYHALVLRYYNEQTNVVRLEVMAILKEKNLSEPWEYTPIFDGLHVPFEHEKWTYGQAATVKAYLEESPQIPA